MTFSLNNTNVAVIGLGYVGMPLAVTMAKSVAVTGYDISERRVQSLQKGIDENNELEESVLSITDCKFTSDVKDIRDCNVYIITVPTPLDKNNKPDLTPLQKSSETLSGLLKNGDIVVYESTVYPGVTEDFCGKILEDGSGLKSGQDFFLGYSPERINPGDRVHTVDKITKVVAGQTPEVTSFLADLYGLVNNKNIFVAKDIKTAEASKAIENAQRDINIAFINEVTMIMNKLGLSAHDVLEASNTKWNFLPFTPGLVGGHCIGVDPYYLAECAENLGHNPEIILSGRRINDDMGRYVASRIDEKVQETGASSKKVLVLGFTFKENIRDIRNTKVIDVANALKEKGYIAILHDPHANAEEVKHEYGLELTKTLPVDEQSFAAIAFLVGHRIYKNTPLKTFTNLLEPDGVMFDLKGLWRAQSKTLNNYITL